MTSSETKTDLKYWLALHCFTKFGPVRFRRLLKFFGSAEAAFKAGSAGLKQAGIEAGIADEFIAFRAGLDPGRLEERLFAEKVQALTIDDKRYPERLKEIYDPPAVLYWRGHLSGESELELAVVGARKYTPYGKQAVLELVPELARNNLAIVSGLALGIDALAHETTLEAGGRTVAVLGSGLDRQNIYPSTNRYLADKIVSSGGLIVSEFPIGTPPLKHNFPQRNRIISGLSVGTLVIEAGEKSGSLITAKCALEQNREVFAVPGSIFSPLSAGTNFLIKRGATPVTAAADILLALDLSQVTAYIDKQIEISSPEEGHVLSFLNQEPRHIDEIARLSGLEIRRLNGLLMMMEMKGLARNLGGMMYVLAR